MTRLSVAFIALGASCFGGAGGSTSPSCDVPSVAFAVPTEHKTPFPYDAKPGDIEVIKVLKDVVYTHARDPKNPWAISHALLAMGPDAELTNQRNAVEYLFEEYAEPFTVCDQTLLRFPASRGSIRIEPHTDLILKALTENGVSPEKKVSVKGQTFTVGDLYRGSLHRAWVVGNETGFGPDGASRDTTAHWNDVPWALQGLSSYASPGLAWKAAGGRAMTMDGFTHAAVERLDQETQALQIARQSGQTFNKQDASRAGGLVSMTCGGAHMVQGVGHALGRGFGEATDKARFDEQVQILFWRYRAELDTYTRALETQPRYRTLLMMQRLKFLGHFVETTHKLAMLGLLNPDPQQRAIMNEATGQLLATTMVLVKTGIFQNLGKLMDPKTPQVYDGVITNEQLYLDYVGDSAHAYRGLDLAIGHGVYRF